VRAADLHQANRRFAGAADPADQLLGDPGIAIFFDMFDGQDIPPRSTRRQHVAGGM
jgi:hypothetical protein